MYVPHVLMFMWSLGPAVKQQQEALINEKEAEDLLQQLSLEEKAMVLSLVRAQDRELHDTTA